MKSRRLTETDLVNMAFLSVGEKERRISRLLAPKRIEGSYEPFRNNVGDAVNEQFPMFAELHAPTTLEMLEGVVKKACKGNEKLLEMNLAVAKATHTFAAENGMTAQRLELRRITLPFGHTYSFGMPLLMCYNSQIAVAFPDLRRTNPLTEDGRVTALSWMHQRFRANYPDHAELALEIWRYENNANRTVRPIRINDSMLYSFDDLWTDASETYQIVHSVQEGLTGDQRKRAGGGYGPLFDS